MDAAFSPDGTALATASCDGEVLLPSQHERKHISQVGGFAGLVKMSR